MKKKLIILGSVVLMAATAVFAFGTIESDSATGLELRNIEALSAGEGVTTWNCGGGMSKCSVTCGICMSNAQGRGRLTGGHRCN